MEEGSILTGRGPTFLVVQIGIQLTPIVTLAASYPLPRKGINYPKIDASLRTGVAMLCRASSNSELKLIAVSSFGWARTGS